jgi:peroxiredoxin
LVSIAFDSLLELAAGADQFGITDVPLASDSDGRISAAYDVLQWAMRNGEPGHTFILVDQEGKIAWIQDYGAPENGGVMYVPPLELVTKIKTALGR